jgi:hypothetical protein
MALFIWKATKLELLYGGNRHFCRFIKEITNQPLISIIVNSKKGKATGGLSLFEVGGRDLVIGSAMNTDLHIHEVLDGYIRIVGFGLANEFRIDVKDAELHDIFGWEVFKTFVLDRR